ncbi:MAG: 2 protein [Patescibacteria group bacterium]|nr:2 protein [Patescibacteria group bacterium]
MLAPEFMTAEGLPHALRAIGTQPVVFIFSGLALNYIFRKSENYNPISRKVVSAVIILMLVFIGVFNGVKYHLFWAKKIETARSFEKTLLDVSDYIRTIPAKKEKFIVTETMQRIPIKIFNPKMPNVSYFYPKEAAQINPRGEDFEIILTERNDEAISILQNKFSELKLEEKKDELGLSFCVLR